MKLSTILETPEDTTRLDELRHHEETIAQRAGSLLASMVMLYAKEQWDLHEHIRHQYHNWMDYFQTEYKALKNDFIAKFSNRVQASFEKSMIDYEKRQ
jgi:hypothetical protein